MNLLTSSAPFAPLVTTVSSPKLDLIVDAWEHIADRYLTRLSSNRIFSGRVRSILSLASYDALHSVIDPGNGHIYKEISAGSTLEAAAAAAVKSSHDILAAIFSERRDREDLADLLEESLALFDKEDEKRAGIDSGSESAAAYLQTFATLLIRDTVVHPPQTTRPQRELALAAPSGRSWSYR